MCKWHCNKKSNSHSACKKELHADLEVELENKITMVLGWEFVKVVLKLLLYLKLFTCLEIITMLN